MCGIVGFIGREAAIDHLLTGLTILENRGYDSAGITTITSDNELLTTKFASVGSTSDAIDHLKKVKNRHDSHPVGIAHTRWATHGGKTDENAHPHIDAKNRVALVHNGVIENSSKLKEELQNKGIVFKSETDTEVIVQLIGDYLDQGISLINAVKNTLNRLEGTWGLAIISKDSPDQIIAARNGSPIVIGVGNGKMFIASEPSAFGQQTKEFIALENGEIAIIKADGHSMDVSRVEKAPDEEIELSPAPSPHWTIKEIFEQPEAISRALNYGGRILDLSHVKLGGLEEQRETLLNVKHLVITACGTSYFAALYGAQIMRSLGAFETVQVVDAAEMSRDMFPKENGGLLVISQSGETKDVHRTVINAQKSGIPVFSVINSVGSLIPRTTRCGVYLNAGREHGVASTKAFTTQVTVLALVAIWFAQNRNSDDQSRRSLIESLHKLPTSIKNSLQAREQCIEVAKRLLKANHCFVLGKGFAEPIAREGSLKIKEITYLHAEGYSGGALKHGPFALIEEGTPIIMTILDDNHAQFMRTAAEEVRARGAHTIIITNKKELADGIADAVIEIPTNGSLTALLAVIPMQLIAYELAVLRGYNPDKPRNLAKAVTVD